MRVAKDVVRCLDGDIEDILWRISDVTTGEALERQRTESRGVLYILPLKGDWPILCLFIWRAHRPKAKPGIWYMRTEWRIRRDTPCTMYEQTISSQLYDPKQLWLSIRRLWHTFPRPAGPGQRRKSKVSKG
jgi:hypothetical protein